LGIGSLLRISANPDRTGLYIFYALAMFGDAAVMFFCFWQLNKRTKIAFSLAAFVLVLNIVLTIFDQVGWVDILFVLLNLLVLSFLIVARKEFLPA
jgi:hypothetical protein